MFPAVHPGLACISPEFEANVRFLMTGVMSRYEEICLSNGAYAGTGHYSLHAHAGSIDPHDDGAGITYGVVVLADDDHILRIEGKEWPLKPGDVFVINSDATHATVCRGSDSGILAFITRDFLHSGEHGEDLAEPTVTVEEYADLATTAIAAYVADGIAKFQEDMVWLA